MNGVHSRFRGKAERLTMALKMTATYAKVSCSSSRDAWPHGCAARMLNRNGPRKSLSAVFICQKRLCCHERLATKQSYLLNGSSHTVRPLLLLEMGKGAKENTRALLRGMLKDIRICLHFRERDVRHFIIWLDNCTAQAFDVGTTLRNIIDFQFRWGSHMLHGGNQSCL